MKYLTRSLAHTGFASVLSVLACLIPALLTGCATPPPPAPAGVAELMDRPAERNLLAGLRLYDDAQYAEAEKSLDEALRLGLASARDRATAHKMLAFIYCTTERTTECEAAFRAALKADPQFALSRAEAGHPVWGPVYARSRR
jgi:Tfp pilus assembly protein PilF